MDKPCHQIRNLQQAVASRGRKPAINEMRQMLIDWLREHKDDAILPGMTVESFVVSDNLGPYRFQSMEEYLQHMAANNEWVDHVMLYAISGVFQVQLVVFIGGQDSHHSNLYNAHRYAPTALSAMISAFSKSSPSGLWHGRPEVKGRGSGVQRPEE